MAAHLTSVTFRLIRPDDLPFLYTVYASTRLEELAPLGWDEAQQAAFLTMQFNAQHRAYQDTYADADFQIILSGNRAVGRLYIARWQEEIRLIDIALLPAYRNTGIGTAILTDILAEAAQVGKPVRIHVEMFNPALRLYERLGFGTLEERGVYYFMEWSPHAVKQR